MNLGSGTIALIALLNRIAIQLCDRLLTLARSPSIQEKLSDGIWLRDPWVPVGGPAIILVSKWLAGRFWS
jgi:hypothetical protein